MGLAAGDNLGHYDILSLIGKGGMGEVYRACDTKLKRDVAAKVLPEIFASDSSRMARFRREAEILASLNHPNITAIYGLEDRALVMELVEGDSPKGPMPFEDARRIAAQIAAAFEYAHEKGAIHRDLKPANVKITPGGVVKLLDFGLAKAFHEPGSAPATDAMNSPTLTMGATAVGVILGTAAYMSPEQAKGKPDADLYIPQVAAGLNIRVGRFLSIPGIEAQLAPNNYIYTHSLLYVIDPFTDTGILGTVKLNDRWLLQMGLTASHDVAPWTQDAKPSATTCISYTFNQGNDNIYPWVNGLNDGKYAYNNPQMFDITWYHKFNASWHMATEAWYMYQRDVPSVSGPLSVEKGTNGAVCSAGEIRCFAPEWAMVNYVEKELSAKSYVSFRTDFLDDMKGQRTGFKTRYTEATLMWGHWVGSTILMRPEIRFDHALDRPAYDYGTRKSQFQLAMDVIFNLKKCCGFQAAAWPWNARPADLLKS